MRLLSLTGLLSCAAAFSYPQSSPSESHRVTLPFSTCSNTCSESPSFLTLNLLAQYDSLLANNDCIFPPSSMKLQASRDWGSDKTRSEDITLAYNLDIKPILSRSESSSPEDILVLNLDLLDLSGRSVTSDTVAIRLAKNADGNLLISKIWTRPSHSARPALIDSSDSQVKSWRTQVNAYLMTMTQAAKSKGCFWCSGSGPHQSPPSKEQAQTALANGHKKPASGYDSSPFRTSSPYQYHPSHQDANQRAFLRLMRPVVIPAILGMLASVIACVIGFFLGRILVSAYFYLRQRQRERVAEDAEEGNWGEGEGEGSEKQVLVRE